MRTSRKALHHNILQGSKIKSNSSEFYSVTNSGSHGADNMVPFEDVINSRGMPVGLTKQGMAWQVTLRDTEVYYVLSYLNGQYLFETDDTGK